MFWGFLYYAQLYVASANLNLKLYLVCNVMLLPQDVSVLLCLEGGVSCEV